MPNGHTPQSDAARDAATQRKLARFLDAFARIGSARKAAKAVRMSTSTVYTARRTDPEFAAAWERIVDAQIDEVEASLYQQAIGVKVPVMHNGKVVGTRIVASDRAAIFMLRTRRPEKYGDPPYPHARGCTVPGYHRDGWRGKIAERVEPTPASVRITAEPETAQAAIEAMQRALLENRKDPAPPPMPPQVHVAANDAQHDAPVAEHIAHVAKDDACAESPHIEPRPRVVVRVAMRQAQPAQGRVGFGWLPRRDEE